MPAGDYKFEPKGRREMVPPQNLSINYFGFEGVRCELELDPARIAYFAREATWGDLFREPTPEELADTLREVQEGKVLGAALEVPALAWRIRASRSTMDQMLRLRESAAGAQTTRDNDMRHFNCIIPQTIDDRLPADLRARVTAQLDALRQLYGDLLDAGVPAQDARYVALPLGFQTQWIQIMNLRAFMKMCEQRLCNGLTQHETNYLVRLMRDQVVVAHPWTTPMLRSHCEKRNQCTSGGMLFPSCGAFGGPVPERETAYSREQNAGAHFAGWDRARKRRELANPGLVYSMSEPSPRVIGGRGGA